MFRWTWKEDLKMVEDEVARVQEKRNSAAWQFNLTDLNKTVSLFFQRRQEGFCTLPIEPQDL